MAYTSGRPYVRAGRGQSRVRGKSRGGKMAAPDKLRNGFKASRVHDTEDIDQPEKVLSEASESEPDSAGQSLSASEEEIPAPQQSYSALLHALKVGRAQNGPPRKKRRTESSGFGERSEKVVEKNIKEEAAANTAHDEEETEAVLSLDIENESDDTGSLTDSEDENDTTLDQFDQHFGLVDEVYLKTAIATYNEKQTRNILLDGTVRKQYISHGNGTTSSPARQSSNVLRFKGRLQESSARIASVLSEEEKDLLNEISSFRDIQYGQRTVQNSTNLRDLVCLHALNHIFKTRDRVLKNNTKLNQTDNNEVLDTRDQGFTRPKVLIIVPTKQACVRFVESIVGASEPEQQENRSRFMEIFAQDDDDAWKNKTDDFRELFGGNHEEDFRIGLKFTRKTIKYFSGFYNSDIIFGSALGLMRTITTGGGRKDKKRGHDADFLSSIEVVVVDNAAAIQMQNFQHLDYVFSQLNQLPKDSHGCDFARVRNWYLDGNAKYLRQTILFTSHHTPELNSLFSNHTYNIAGNVKYTPTYNGAMLSVPHSVSALTIPQTFLRFDSSSPQTDSDLRFRVFTTTILPSLLRHSVKGALVFIPTFADFVRVRNHLATAHEATSLSFGSVSEYTSVRDTARARSHFATGRHTVLIYSERAHHHFRYRIRGVKRIVFYGVPENPLFWPEIMDLLGLGLSSPEEEGPGGGGGDDVELVQKKQKGIVRALFSKWDVLKLERIVGTDRVGRLVADPAADVFDFV